MGAVGGFAKAKGNNRSRSRLSGFSPFRHAALVLTVGIIIAFTAINAAAQASRAGGWEGSNMRVVLILAAEMTWSDLSAPNLGPMAPFIDEAALAFVNSATAGWMIPPHAYATVGAGARAVAAKEGGVALEPGELYMGREAARVYLERTGSAAGISEAGGSGKCSHPVFHLGIGAMENENASYPASGSIGRLGGALATAGVTTALYGNADLPGLPFRPGALITMDASGFTCLGRVGASVLSPAASMPGGTLTDWAAVAHAWAGDGADFSVIEAGDFLRLEQSRPQLTRQAYSEARHRARDNFAHGMAAFLEFAESRARKQEGEEHLIILLSPAPSPPLLPGGTAAGGNGGPRHGFGWVAAWRFPGDPAAGDDGDGGGSGDGEGGNGGVKLLTSPTTRRPGLVTLVDIAPTVLEAFGLLDTFGRNGRPGTGDGVRAKHGTHVWTGRPLRWVVENAPSEPGCSMTAINWLEERYGPAAENHTRRVPLLQGYVLLYIAVVLAGLTAVFVPPWKEAMRPVLDATILAVALIPLIWLLLPVFPGRGPVPAAAITLLLAAPSAWAAVNLFPVTAERPPYAPLALIGIVTFIAVVVDTAFGSPMTVQSPLGYSLVAGARYYGVGNEYMGIIIGGMSVGLGGLLQWLRIPWPGGRWIMSGGMAATAAVLGAPGLGVNFGGAMAAALTAAIVFTGLGGRRPKSNLRLSAARRGRGAVGPAGGEAVPGTGAGAAGRAAGTGAGAAGADAGWGVRAARGLVTKESLRPLLMTGIAAAAVTAGLLAAGEAFRGEEVSHIGLAARRVAAGDWAGIAAIAAGKLKTNLRLFRWTIWMRALVAGLGAMVILSFRPKGAYRRFVSRHPYLGTGMAAAAGGAAAALLFNDSGVVAAATAMIIPAATALRVLLYAADPGTAAEPGPAAGVRFGTGGVGDTENSSKISE